MGQVRTATRLAYLSKKPPEDLANPTDAYGDVKRDTDGYPTNIEQKPIDQTPAEPQLRGRRPRAARGL